MLAILRTQAPFAVFWWTVGRVSSVALGLSGASCDFDDRTLYPAPLGSAGEGGEAGEVSSVATTSGNTTTASSSAGGTAAGANATSNMSTSGSGGASAATSTTYPAPPSTNADCPDLDGNSVDDCGETLVDNPGFEANTENWDAQAPVEFAWQAGGSAGSESGSVGVVLSSTSDRRSMGGVYQCLEVEAGSRYAVYAQTFIPADESSAALSVLFHDTNDCSGTHIDGANSTLLSAADHWRVLHMRELAPPGAQSMTVRLAAVKEPAVDSVEVRFDNVLVLAE